MSSVHTDLFGSQASAYIDGETVQFHFPEWSGRIPSRADALEQLEKLDIFLKMTKAILQSGDSAEDEPSGDDDGGDDPYAESPEYVEEGQALVVDGQTVRAADVRRMINAFQRTRWTLIMTGIELNKRDQTIRRLEAELGDCGYAPTYSITPFGYDVLRDMGR